ncbi:MAG: DUF4139 domain-containing protein [Crocinitomicaceae bacterium]|nr:DUF4139 domain-containing protein [Crocinitomicaceae bacterium]
MKKLISLICFLTIVIGVKAEDEKVVSSSISKVTVFSQGAQIYRTASYSIGKGLTQVVIEGVSPKIDAKSLQVKATGNVIILDSKYNLFYPKPVETPLQGIPLKIRKQINSLTDSIQDINFSISDKQDEIDVLNATKRILTNNGAIKGQGKVNDSIALLKEAIDYYTFKMMEINKKLQRLNRMRRMESQALTEMQNRLNILKNYQNNAQLNPSPKGPIHRITVTLSAKDYAKGKLNVSYLVSQAGWIPSYDLRSDIKSGKVNLNYKAQVYQNTGIDWKNVRLNISTNNPYQNKTKPLLHPWYVDYYQFRYENQGQNTSGARPSALERKAKAYGYTNTMDAKSEDVDLELDAMTANSFVEVVDHLISAEFRIDLPYSIKSNNEKHMVLVKNVDLKADYKYYAVPKHDQSAYLVAQISKLDELQLVPAKANIFFDGSYIGETYLDPTTMNDTLNLSLGKDPNIIVKRTLIKREFKEKVIGTKKERTFAYRIQIKNLKSTPIELVVQDQIPITQNAEIEIEALNLSKGKLHKNNGIVDWSFTLKPKAEKEIILKYLIKHDKDKNVPVQ